MRSCNCQSKLPSTASRFQPLCLRSKMVERSFSFLSPGPTRCARAAFVDFSSALSAETTRERPPSCQKKEKLPRVIAMVWACPPSLGSPFSFSCVFKFLQRELPVSECYLRQSRFDARRRFVVVWPPLNYRDWGAERRKQEEKFQVDPPNFNRERS
jgi:hypothetical protein